MMMLKFLRASALRFYVHTSVSRASGASRISFLTSPPGSSAHHRAGGAASKPPQELYTLVEPKTQEQFVFLDLEEPVKSDHADAEALELQRLRAASEVPREKPLHLGALRSRLKHLKGPGEPGEPEESEEHSLIEFHDEGFVPRRSKKTRKQQKVYGTPDEEVEVSDSHCSGCSALMHCTDPQIPGYLPSEKYKALLEEDGLKKAICQRCFLIKHQQKALSVSVSAEEYLAVVSRVRSESALVLLIADLLDLPDSIVPDLPELVGQNKHMVVLGNKVDLLPRDAENYLQRIRRQLMSYCGRMGVSTADPRDYHLISAKTGYGIEKLISRLQATWKHKGDVYLVGMANSGKSTLFNTLLESDYCKSRAADVIHKATISPWPGTTLDLLKFPIINPTPQRMFRRAERLRRVSGLTEELISPQERQRIRQFSRQGYLIGHVGRTFKTNPSPRRNLVEFDPDSLSFGDEPQEGVRQNPSSHPELSYNEIKDAHWFYDTPGIVKERDVLSLLTEQEVKLVVPTHAIVPRTFVLKPGTVLFLGALARIDYLEGKSSCWFTVVASSRVPVHITALDKADDIYHKHAGKTLLAVPSGGEERMKSFPPFVTQDFELQGLESDAAITDIKISSAGWVAVTAEKGDRLLLRTHAPEGAGLCLRTPPLLPHIVSVKGQRIPKSPAYKTRKPKALVDIGLSAKAAQRLSR